MVVTTLIGPVVGHVTTTTAIILLEVDQDSELQCRVSKDNGDNKTNSVTKPVTVAAIFKARKAGIFRVNDLEPGSRYKFIIDDVSEGQGSFRTFGRNPENFSIGIVSCDKAKNSDSNMWGSLAAEAGGMDVVFHLGDNVYIDEFTKGSDSVTMDELISDEVLFSKNIDLTIPYVAARFLLKDKPSNEWPNYTDEIMEIYKEKYRETWFRPNVKTVLANTSNLMILDDHDIRNNFGDHPIDGDKSSKEHFLSTIAMQLYHEYQRQLWDPDFAAKADDLCNEFYSIQIGPLLVAMFDSRTPNGYYKDKREQGDESHFGKQQWNDFKKCLDEGENKGARILLINSTLPLFFINTRMTNLIADNKLVVKGAEDAKGFINYNHSETNKPPQEVSDLIETIDKWKNSETSKSPRAAFIMSGDVHLGGFTDIYKETSDGSVDVICRQVSSGAISLKYQGEALYLMKKILLNFTDTFGDYEYKHYDWTKDTNYVTLKICLTPKSLEYDVHLKATGGEKVHSSKITADGKYEEDTWFSKGFFSKCNII